MTAPVSVTRLAGYRNETPYPFCPGCGHGSILDRLNEALVALGKDPGEIVLVSDIGCSGLSDQYFDTHAFHGLHGRSVTYATGIKLAKPELTVIVIMGDGGTGIGGAHLLAAARRNLDLTVLVFNNFNYGMTGGQQSATTPEGAVTSTSPDGSLERPVDLCKVAAASGATYVCRSTSFDSDLAERIGEGIRHPGFALLDIWEPCTAYFAPRNKLGKQATLDLIHQLGFARGVMHVGDAPEFGAAYRASASSRSAGLQACPLERRFHSSLSRRFCVVLAGAAGGRVGTAARVLCEAAILSGLYAAERRDYPVTVKTGYSIAEVVLSPAPIEDVNVALADAVILLAPEGRAHALSYRLREGGLFYEAPGKGRPADAMAAMKEIALRLELVPEEALSAATA